jgi:hypothetical protein
MYDATLTGEIAAAARHSLREYLPSSFSLTPASKKSDQAWDSQWRALSTRKPPNGGWNWPSCRSTYGRDTSSMLAAMWCRNETELCGFVLLRMNSTACRIAMVEGSPDPHHSIRGMVLPVAVELASMYAQKTGRRDVWVSGPINAMVLQYLMNAYDFEAVSPKNGFAFCRREV